ncbi:uncharacterized protein LOC125781279 [Astyanax mexicanus]|nr:uncharacterized protein LOC125781279 [Astyanax mexicanus]XP_049320846.1 uncharacterized protein LOC125781279 [Astyanax mexicanus]
MIPVVLEEAPLDPDSREMWYIMTRRQHLLSRRIILLEMKEFLKNNSLTGGVLENDDEDGPSELDKIDNELQSLSDRETALVNRRCLWEKQGILSETTRESSVIEPECVTPEGNKKDVMFSGVCILPNVITTQDLITEQPLEINVEPNQESSEDGVVDVENLAYAAGKVRCPSCQQNITTEIQYKVGKSSYFLCLIAIFMGCVAGCCLLPFFLNYFKEVCHVCPSCHTEIRKVRRM